MTMTDKLLIKFTSYTKISEIEVFGGKNVAFSKETEQSSTYREKGVFLTSDKAVDGWNSNYEFSKISCTHTVPYKSNPYWKVNLGDFYAVMSILISNRDDSNRRRIDGFTLYGKTRDGTENLIYNDTNKSSSGRKEILIDSSYMLWEQVSQIIIKGEHISSEKILTLCEVFVFACIPVKTTSAYCLGFCPKNCHPEETCLNENFTCSQCIPGWTGPYCDQPIKCAKPVLSDRLHVTDDKQSYVYGEEIQFLCEIGFRLLGTTRATCGNGKQL
ncbi:fucolectin-1-like [Saccostrea cucullata]|uniref:fucolectin-1-like n=1 Tax=Saccostrea cuccullata TaxID=36930 RepID=UPI002ED4E899